MPSQHASAYRHILRELRKAARSSSRPSVSKTLSAGFRAIFEAHRPSSSGHGSRNTSSQFTRDIENAVAFMRSQREHKALLAKYNPLFDLTAQERIKATARRVGLDMPITPKSVSDE